MTLIFHVLTSSLLIWDLPFICAKNIKAKAIIIRDDLLVSGIPSDGQNPILGSITFSHADGYDVMVTGALEGLSPGKHGFHIHTQGNIVGGCNSTGGKQNARLRKTEP